jgi:putative ABC transport system permease protein
MKITDIFKLSLNSLTHRGLRSWLTILGIIIGVAAVVAMLSIGTGMTESVGAEMSGFGADILTVSAGYIRAEGSMGGFGGREMPRMGNPFGVTLEGEDDDEPTLTELDIYAISSAEGVELVNGIISGQAEVQYLAEEVRVSVEGIDPVAWSEMTTSELEAGRFLSQGDGNSVVIGSMVTEMYEQTLSVGTQIRIEGTTFKIIGILKESGTGGFGGDDRIVFMTHNAARNIIDSVDSDEYSSIELKISDTDLSSNR